MGALYYRISGFVVSFCLMLLLNSQVYGQDVQFDYAVAMGDVGSELSESIAFDSSGNVFVTASFEGTVDFDPGPGTSNLTSAGLDDVAVVKLDDTGAFLWARSVGGLGAEYSLDLEVDATGNVYVVGEFEGTADFNPGVGTANHTSNGLEDFFVFALDSNGVYIFSNTFGGT